MAHAPVRRARALRAPPLRSALPWLVLLVLGTLAALPSGAAAATTISTAGCSAPGAIGLGTVIPTVSATTSLRCSVTFGETAGTARLSVVQTDGAGTAVAGVPDYALGSADWTSAMFGACLETLDANGTANWTVDPSGACTASDTDPWRGIPTTSIPASNIADSLAGVTPVAGIRFGARVGAATPAGAYTAPLTFEVVPTSVNNPPTVPSYTSPGAGATVYDVATALSATFQDTDPAETGQVNYRLDTTAGCDATPIQSGSSAATFTTGQSAPWIPPTPLTVGTVYHWCAQGQDAGGLAGPWTVSRSFTVAAPTGGPFFALGFEQGVGSQALVCPSLFGAAGVSSPTARSGSYSLRLNNANDVGCEAPYPGSTSGAAARFSIRVASFPSATTGIAELNDTLTGQNCGIQLTAAGQLRGRVGATTTAGVAIAPGTWYEVDMRCTATANPWRVDWSLDGVAQTGGTWAQAVGAFETIGFGKYTGASVAADYLLDDLYATTAAAYPIGGVKILPFVPDSTGTHSSPSSFGASTTNGAPCNALGAGDSNTAVGSHQRIDEWPPATGAGADLVCQTAPSGYLEYQIADSAEATAPLSVRVTGAVRESAAAPNQTTLTAVSGTSGQVYADFDPNATLQYPSGQLATVPGAVTAWSDSAFDALRLRIRSSGDVNPNPWTDALLVEAAFAYTINTTPPLPTYVSPANGATIYDITPQLDATFEDNDAGDTGQVNFRLDTIGTCDITPIQSGSSAPGLLDNATGSWSPPLPLTVGTVYYWCAQGQDAGGLTSAWTVSRSFTVTAPPSSSLAVLGFELGVNGTADICQSGSNLPGVTSSGTARNGSYSMRINTASANTWCGPTFPAATILVHRGSVRLAALPSGIIKPLSVGKAVNADQCDVGFTATGQTWAGLGSSVQVYGPTIPVGQWVDFDVRCDKSANPWVLDWRVNGVDQTPATLASAVNDSTTLDIGTNVGSSVADFLVDDVVVSNNSADYPLGNLRVLPYLPTGTGTHLNPADFSFSTANGGGLTPLTAGDNLQTPGSAIYLDERPPVTGAGSELVAQTAATGYLRYSMANSAEPTPPVGVHVFGAVRNQAAAANQNTLAAVSGTTGQVYANFNAGVTTARYPNGQLGSIPGSIGAWTDAAFDALELQISSGGDVTPNPWTDALLVEAAFTAPDVALESPTNAGPVFSQLPTLTASYRDAEAHTGQISFRIGTSATCGTGVVASGTSVAGLASGTSGSWTDNVSLTVGTTYYWCAQATDSSGVASGWTGTFRFTVRNPPSIVAMNGFESSAAAATSDGFLTASTPTWSTATRRSGRASLYANAGAAVDGVRWTPTVAPSITVQRIYVRAEANGGAGTSILAAYVSAGSLDLDFNLSGSNELSMEWCTPGCGGQVTGPTLTLGQWYRIDLRTDTSTGTLRADWSVDGIAQPASIVAGAADTQDSLRAVSDGPASVRYDDWMISTTSTDYPIGAGYIDSLFPTGEGTHATPGSFGSDAGALGVNPQLRIDDTPAWGLADFVAQTATGAGSYLEWTMSDPLERSTTAVAVRSVVGFHSTTAAGNNGQAKVVRAGDTDVAAPVVQTGNMSFTTVRAAGQIVTPPGTNWTPVALDALRVRTGYSTDVTPNPSWDAVGLEVAYPGP